MSRMQSTDHEEAIFDRQHKKMVNWPDCGGVQIVTARKCNIKHNRQLYSRLVLPPYTVKIRGGRLGIIIEMSSCPTNNTVKTRGGRSTFYHGHREIHLSTMRLVTSVNHSSSAIQVVRLYSGSTPF